MKRILVIFLLISCSLSNLTFAKVSDSLIVEDLSFKTARIQENFREVESDIQKLKKDVKENTENIEEHDTLYKDWKWILSILVIFGVTSLISCLFFLKSYVKTEIMKIVTDYGEYLHQLVNDAIDSKITRKKTKILIMGSEEKNLKVKNLLKLNGFEKVTIINNLDESDEIFTNDLVIFTDFHPDKKENIGAIEKMIRKNPYNGKYFYYGDGFFTDEGILNSFEYKVSSSKFPSQIIGNITNLLNYK